MQQQGKPAPAIETEGTWPFLCRPGQTFGYRLWTVTHAWQRRFETALAPLGLPVGAATCLGACLVAVGTVVLANVVAAVPARTAARTPTALMLRAE